MNPMNLFNGGNQMNPLQLIKAMQGGGNPAQIMQAMLGNNPMYQRVMQMVDGKSPEEIRSIASNLCQQRGIDLNDAINQMRGLGLNIPDIDKFDSR